MCIWCAIFLPMDVIMTFYIFFHKTAFTFAKQIRVGALFELGHCEFLQIRCCELCDRLPFVQQWKEEAGLNVIQHTTTFTVHIFTMHWRLLFMAYTMKMAVI